MSKTLRQIMIGIMITVGSATIIAILAGTINIYTAVSYDIPAQIKSIRKDIANSNHNNLLYEQANKQQHGDIHRRLDKVTEKFNILLKNILEIKSKVNMPIQYNDIVYNDSLTDKIK